MKRYLKPIIFIFLSAFIFPTCTKLVENPSSVIVSSQFYQTSSDAVAAVNAVYNTLNSDPLGDFPMYGRQLNLLTDNASDNQNFSPSNTNPDVRAKSTVTYVSINGRILKNWQQHYFGINRANIAIDNIAAIPVSQFSSPALQSRLINEAKFIRALLYFNLVRLFGPVPLVLHNPTSVDVSSLQVPRSSTDSVYAQIIQDLTDASSLPISYSGADIGQGDQWCGACPASQGICDDKTMDARTGTGTRRHQRRVWICPIPQFPGCISKATKNGVEHIFSVQYVTNGGEANTTQYLSQSFNSFNTGTYPIDIPSDSSIAALFDSSDTRKAVSFYTSQFNAVNRQTVIFHNPYTPYFNKFVAL